MKIWPMRSLQQRLMLGLLVVTLSYWSVIAWLTVRDEATEIYELFDAHLAQTALAILRVTDPDDIGALSVTNPVDSPSMKEIFGQWPDLPVRLSHMRARSPLHDDAQGNGQAHADGSINALHAQYERNLRYQVWSGNGSLLLKSSNAPTEVMTPANGYSESTDERGQEWRHFAIWDLHHDFRIVVAEAHDLRNQLVRNIVWHVVSPLVLGLPVFMMLLWWAIHRGLRPMRRLSGEVAQRAPDNLKLFDPDHRPEEMQAIVLALNDLLSRVTHSLDGERRFTASAAHELRTPLAALQAQLHLLRLAQDDGERQRATDQLGRGVERATRLVGQMLTLARLDPEQVLPDAQVVDLHEVALDSCAEMAPLALQREQTLELDAHDAPVNVMGNADCLTMLLCNLLDNAVRYTPRGGRIAVRLFTENQQAVAEVTDNGPGIPAEQRERVFERFVRLAQSDQPGTGLGLAICRRVAELHHASLTLRDGPEGRGTTFCLRLALA